MSQWKVKIYDQIKKKSQWLHEIEATDRDDAKQATRHLLQQVIDELNQNAGSQLYTQTDYLILQVEPETKPRAE